MPTIFPAALQRALYSQVIRRLRAFPALEVSALRHFDALPDHVRARRLYRLKALKRPEYFLGVRRAFDLAARLGLSQFSILEFGVAEGNGLINLQNTVKAALTDPANKGKSVRIFGFDTFEGMPALTDYKDGSSLWKAGDYPSDIQAIRALADDELITLVPGLFGDAIPTVLDQLREYPPLFIAIDADLYSSCVSVFDGLFGAGAVPAVSYWYFDDVQLNFYSDNVGERLAIREFNAKQDNPYRFVTDYAALYDVGALPLATVLTQLYHCVNDVAFERDQRFYKEAVTRLPLDPAEFKLFS